MAGAGASLVRVVRDVGIGVHLASEGSTIRHHIKLRNRLIPRQRRRLPVLTRNRNRPPRQATRRPANDVPKIPLLRVLKRHVAHGAIAPPRIVVVQLAPLAPRVDLAVLKVQMLGLVVLLEAGECAVSLLADDELVGCDGVGRGRAVVAEAAFPLLG